MDFRIVALASGGLDSLVMCETLRRAKTLAAMVFVDYQHPAQVKEAWKVFQYHGVTGVPLHVAHAFGLALGAMSEPRGPSVVPARNLIMLSLAANHAASIGAHAVAIGCTAEDRSNYPDCSPAFIHHASRTMREAYGVQVLAPMLNMQRSRVVLQAEAYGIRRGDYWPCYRGETEPCGTCASCRQEQVPRAEDLP